MKNITSKNWEGRIKEYSKDYKTEIVRDTKTENTSMPLEVVKVTDDVIEIRNEKIQLTFYGKVKVEMDRIKDYIKLIITDKHGYVEFHWDRNNKVQDKMTRTQIYLTQKQINNIDEEAKDQGVRRSEIIRKALDEYFEGRVL